MNDTMPHLYGALESADPLFQQFLGWVAEIEAIPAIAALNDEWAGVETKGPLAFMFVPGGADSRVAHWPMLGKPVLAVGVVVAYLVGIAALTLIASTCLPKFKLTPVVAVYNIVCAGMSFYMVYESALAFSALYGWGSMAKPADMWCHPLDTGSDGTSSDWSSPMSLRLASIIYVHFLMKMVELSDTGIMILKQNWNQLSFLHVYHHASVIFPTWQMNMTYLPGGAAWWCCFLNSLVHTFMYTHYGLRSVGIVLPVKPLLTTLQLVQFVTYIHQAWYLLTVDPARNCVPVTLPAWQLAIQGSIFFILFSHFFVKAYLLPKPAKKTKKE